MASRHRHGGSGCDSLGGTELHSGRATSNDKWYYYHKTKVRRKRLYPRVRFKKLDLREARLQIRALLADYYRHTWGYTQVETIRDQLKIETCIVKKVFQELNLAGILSQAQHKNGRALRDEDGSGWIGDCYIFLKDPILWEI